MYVRAWQAILVGTVLALVIGLGVLLPRCEGPGPHPFTRTALTTAVHPVILLVPRARVVARMRQGYWCTRAAPGWFECTPAAPR